MEKIGDFSVSSGCCVPLSRGYNWFGLDEDSGINTTRDRVLLKRAQTLPQFAFDKAIQLWMTPVDVRRRPKSSGYVPGTRSSGPAVHRRG